MSHDQSAPATGRHASAAPRRGRVVVVTVPVALALALGVGFGAGHVSRDGEVSRLRAARDAERSAAADSQRVAEDAADRAAAADHSAYLATALTHHAADRATLAGAQTRQAVLRAAACRTAMRREMDDVTVLLDILNRDDPRYTVKRLKDVDADTTGIRACLGPHAPAPTTPAPTAAPSGTPSATPPAVAARPTD